MNITVETVKQSFAFYGFTYCPLEDEQIINLANGGLSERDIYTIGCDVHSGIDYHVAVECVLKELIREEEK